MAIPFPSASPSPASPFQARAEERGGHGERDSDSAVRAEPAGWPRALEEGREGADPKREIQDEAGRALRRAGYPRPGSDGCWELHLRVWGAGEHSCFESEW